MRPYKEKCINKIRKLLNRIINNNYEFDLKLYGSYVPESSSRNSFYETIEDAFNDIKDEVKDYIELK